MYQSLAIHFVLCWAFAAASPRLGPYKIDVTELAVCEDGGTNQVVIPTRISKRNNLPPLYNGTIKFGVPLDEKFWIHNECAAWGNQGYRRRSYEYMFKGCREVLKYFALIFKTAFISGGIVQEECPYPAMDIHLKGVDIIQFNLTQFKSLHYNKYKNTYTYFYDGSKVGCLIVYVNVLPLDDRR